jgi:hypothetical protein
VELVQWVACRLSEYEVVGDAMLVVNADGRNAVAKVLQGRHQPSGWFCNGAVVE